MDTFTRQMLEILGCVAVGGLAGLVLVAATMRTKKNPRHRRG